MSRKNNVRHWIVGAVVFALSIWALFTLISRAEREACDNAPIPPSDVRCE